jgi:hypothetical protein
MYLMNNIFIRYLLFSASALLFSANRAVAQNSSTSFLIRPWSVGQSITLQTKTFKDNDFINAETITYSIVDQETVKGKNYFWLEIERSESNSVTITKKIEVRQPGGIDFENVLSGDYGVLTARRRMQQISAKGLKRPSSLSESELSSEAVSQIENGPDPSETKDLTNQFSVTADQLVTVSAGTFKTAQFHRAVFPVSVATPGSVSLSNTTVDEHSRSLDAWGTPDIPIWGLVKKTTKSQGANQEIFTCQTELLAYSESGAVSKLKGRPQLIPLRYQEEIQGKISKDHPDLFLGQEDIEK